MATNIGVEIEYYQAQRPGQHLRHPRLSGDDRWPNSCTDHATYQKFNGSLDTLNTCRVLASCKLPVSCHINHQQSEDPLTTTSEGALVVDVDQNGTYTSRPFDLKDLEDPFHKVEPPCVRRIWNKELAKKSFPGQTPETQNWVVKSEYLCATKYGKRPDTDYPWQGMEINSPIMSDPVEIDQLPTTVAKVYNGMADGLVIFVDENCGLHIHASPPSGSIAVQQAKRVIAMTRILEAFILLIVHPARRHGDYAKPIGSASAFGKESRLTEEPPPSPVESFKETLESLGRFRSQLQNRSPDEPYAFRFMGLTFAAKTRKDLERGLKWDREGRGPARCGVALSDLGSWELRHPQSSFDPEWVPFWVTFVQKIFQICEGPDESFSASFERMYELGTRQPALSWESWLEELGLSEHRAVCDRHIRQANSPRRSEIVPKPVPKPDGV